MEFEDGTPQDAVLCSQSRDSCDGALQQWKPCGTSAIQDNLICGKFSDLVFYIPKIGLN